MINYAYPDIFLTEGTTVQLLITDGTVTVSGDTYTVSDDTATFTNEDIESESFSLEQSINSSDQLTFGSCEAAAVSFIIHKSGDELNGKVLTVYFIPDGKASKMLQLCVFKVDVDKRLTPDGKKRRITGYDAMYDILNADVTEWYNTQLPDDSTTKTIAELRASLLSEFNITAESTTLVNDTLVISRTIDSQQISGADIIRAICELNGVFGMITNEGKFRFLSLQANILSPTPSIIPVTQYMDLQFEEHAFKAIKKVRIIRDQEVTVESSQSATGNYNTYTIAYNPLISNYSEAALQSVANDLCDQMYGHLYLPCEINTQGNPVHEVGDPVAIETIYNFDIITYILERKLTGIQSLRDAYKANGVEYLSDNLNKQSTQTKAVQSQVSQMAQAYANSDTDFVETIRNIGFRLLDEPSNVNVYFDKDIGEVQIKWTDPADIMTLEPVPCEWAGTIVVRKEGSAPRHRWDGVLITDSTTRDQYASNPLVDNTINISKQYYYGIFPYHIWLNDTANPIKHYRYTKCVKINGIDAGEEIVIFENGLFNTSVMADDFDLSNYKSSDISDYYLTKWVLYDGLNSNWRPLQLDNGMIKAEYRSGWSNCDCYLPIKRNANISKIIARAKFTRLAERDQDFNQLQLNIGKVENNTLIIQRSEVYSRFTEWTNIEIETSNFGDIDYIGFLYYDGEFVIDKVSYISR